MIDLKDSYRGYDKWKAWDFCTPDSVAAVAGYDGVVVDVGKNRSNVN